MTENRNTARASLRRGCQCGPSARWLVASAFAVCALGVSLASQAPLTVRYFYDDVGQLQKVVDSTGVVVEYVYDAVGNMLEIRRSTSPPGSPAIFNFVPGQGGPMTIVTLRGQGFAGALTENVVKFNGTVGSVVSASSDTLVASVPVGATSGPISVTVAGSTATSSSPFIAMAVPLITAVVPRAIEVARAPASLSLSGANLSGTQFAALPSFVPPALSFGAPQIDATGMAATLPLIVSPNASGTFVVVATNAVGSSPAFASNGNTLSVANLRDNVDSDGDGFPDALELLLGSNPFDAASIPNVNASGDVTSPQASMLNASSPVIGQTMARETDSGLASLLNDVSPLTSHPIAAEVTTSQLSLLNSSSPVAGKSLLAEVLSPVVSLQNGTAGSATATGAIPASSEAATSLADRNARAATGGGAPVLRIDRAAGLNSVYEGETITLAVDIADTLAPRAVRFLVDGFPFAAVLSAPYTLTFTVPAGVASVVFRALVADSDGTNRASKELAIAVSKPLTGAVVGRVVDSQGGPLRNASVEVTSKGLRAQYFDFEIPLTTMPELRDRGPDLTGFVSAINILNPERMFGSDPLGVGLNPDYAARFAGFMHIEAAGRYEFGAIADEGVRVVLDGVTVMDRRTGDGSREAVQAEVDLPAGQIPVEISYYSGVGNAELQFYYRPSGGKWQIVAPDMLRPDAALTTVSTDENGTFALEGLPVHLGPLRLAISHAGALTERLTVVPAAGKSTSVGDISVNPR